MNFSATITILATFFDVLGWNPKTSSKIFFLNQPYKNFGMFSWFNTFNFELGFDYNWLICNDSLSKIVIQTYMNYLCPSLILNDLIEEWSDLGHHFSEISLKLIRLHCLLKFVLKLGRRSSQLNCYCEMGYDVNISCFKWIRLENWKLLIYMLFGLGWISFRLKLDCVKIQMVWNFLYSILGFILLMYCHIKAHLMLKNLGFSVFSMWHLYFLCVFMLSFVGK